MAEALCALGELVTDPLPHSSHRPSLAKSIGWFAIAQFLSLVLSVAAAMVLARLLLPQDYAIMATIVPIIGAAQVVQALGLGSAIVKAETISKRQLDALFWLVLSLSIVLAVLVAAAGPAFGYWLTGLHLAPEYAFLSLALISSALASQPIAMLMRSLRFRAIAVINIFTNALGIVITVALAAVLHNHWALLVSPVLVPLLNFASAAYLLRWWPGLPGMGEGLGPLLGFGLRVWATNLLNFVSRNADNLIVAGSSTPYQLGIYDRSYRVVIYPLTQAVIPLGQVLVPTLTRIVANTALYRLQFWRVTGLLLLVCMPGLTIITAFPVTLIGLLLGPAWLEGGPLFGWFAGAAMVEIVLSTLNWLMTSQGRGSALWRAGLFNSIVALASFGLGILWGILGVAIAFTIGRVMLCLPFVFWLAGRKGPVGHRELASGLGPHAMALFLTILATWTVRQAFGTPLWPMLISTGFAAYAIYLSVLYALPGSRAILRNLISK